MWGRNMKRKGLRMLPTPVKTSALSDETGLALLFTEATE